MIIKGYFVIKIFFSEVVNIVVEYYISFMIDCNMCFVMLIMSVVGGMDIEEVVC